MMKALNLSFFDQGKFVGMDESIKRLRVAMKKIPDDQKRMIALQKIFGEEGQRAALGFLNAKKGFNEIEIAGQGALSMAQKLAIWGTGFNASMEKLTGTTRSTLATLFDPMLGPLTAAVDKTNELTGALGAYAEKHKAVSQGTSYGLGALALGAGAYAAYKLTRGGISGSRVLKAVLGKGGATSTAAGIARGKAIQAATGVQPVFVTNFPEGFGTGSAVAETAAAAAGGGILSKIKGFGAKVLGTPAGSVALAGAAGYGAGSLLNKYLIDGTAFGDAIGKNMNRIFAAFGNKLSQQALAAEGSIHIKIDSERPIRIRKLQAKGMNIDVDTGRMPVGAG